MTHLERLQQKGIRRLGTPKRGFRYQSPNGRLTQADLQRIYELKIPPAWTDDYKQLEKMQRDVGNTSITRTTDVLRSCASFSD